MDDLLLLVIVVLIGLVLWIWRLQKNVDHQTVVILGQARDYETKRDIEEDKAEKAEAANDKIAQRTALAYVQLYDELADVSREAAMRNEAVASERRRRPKTPRGNDKSSSGNNVAAPSDSKLA